MRYSHWKSGRREQGSDSEESSVAQPTSFDSWRGSLGFRFFQIPEDFPAGLAFKLRSAGMKLTVSDGPLFPAREIKSDVEASAIRKGNQAAASGIRAAEKMLRQSVVKNGRLYLDGRLLTSERVQEAIEIACIEKGAVAAGTIVAGGDQGCDPHCRGSGTLRPNELVIVDVFPRVKSSGYHGDMTRTLLKGAGRATDSANWSDV